MKPVFENWNTSQTVFRKSENQSNWFSRSEYRQTGFRKSEHQSNQFLKIGKPVKPVFENPETSQTGFPKGRGGSATEREEEEERVGYEVIELFLDIDYLKGSFS